MTRLPIVTIKVLLIFMSIIHPDFPVVRSTAAYPLPAALSEAVDCSDSWMGWRQKVPETDGQPEAAAIVLARWWIWMLFLHIIDWLVARLL